MELQRKTVRYTTQQVYETLHTVSENTKFIWVVFHGIGHLSRYFLRAFATLPKDTHYIIAPQAPSKYYLDRDYRHVGASWLTREDTGDEITNLMAYLDAVWARESHAIQGRKLILLGFSQGVSVVTRWLAYRQLACDTLVLFAGSIPDELTTDDFDFLDGKTKVISCVGKQDTLLSKAKKQEEVEKLDKLFRGSWHAVTFEGGHEIPASIIGQITKSHIDDIGE